MKRTTNGFTIAELITVITLISILASIGFISYDKIQEDTYNQQRSLKISIIAEALEKYYDNNGEYPDCDAMTQTSETVTTETLKGMDPQVLTTPKNPTDTNSIICVEPTSDKFAYIGDGTQFTLKYKNGSSGDVVSLESRR